MPANVGIQGNRFTLNGTPWIPKAFNISGFVSTSAYLQCAPMSSSCEHNSLAKYHGYLADSACTAELFRAIKTFGADTVRFLVSQYFLNYYIDPASKDGTYYRCDYFDQIKAIISQARAADLVVLVAMQEEAEGGGPTFHGLPTVETLQNWLLLNQYFGGDQGVMYELYNEPNQDPPLRPLEAPSSAAWTLWRDGGTGYVPKRHRGEPPVAFTAIGMQELVTQLRNAGSMNTFVLDGLGLATTLNGVLPVNDPRDRVGYGIHQYLHGTEVGPSQWEFNFGGQSSTLPIFVDEWFGCANTKPGLDGLPSYQPAVAFLNYLQDNGIGIGGWAIDVPGYMVNDIPNVEDPPDPSSPCAGWQQPSYYAGYPTPSMSPMASTTPTPVGDAGVLIINAFLADYSRPLTLEDGAALNQPPPPTPAGTPYATPSYSAVDCSTGTEGQQ